MVIRRSISQPSSAALGPDGTLYVPDSRYLSALDIQGNLKWKTILSLSGYRSSPVVDSENTIYIVDHNTVRAFDSLGNEKWRFSMDWPAHGARSLSIGPNNMLFVPVGSKLYAFGPGPAPPPEDLPPTCIIQLQKDVVEINEVDVGEFFDIYAGDSSDDIKEVRFSSDDVQDGSPTGKWTEWYDWDVSSGDWNADTKIKRWAFATPGYKEVWEEVEDDVGQTDTCRANILALALIVATDKPSYNLGEKVWISYEVTPNTPHNIEITITDPNQQHTTITGTPPINKHQFEYKTTSTEGTYTIHATATTQTQTITKTGTFKVEQPLQNILQQYKKTGENVYHWHTIKSNTKTYKVYIYTKENLGQFDQTIKQHLTTSDYITGTII